MHNLRIILVVLGLAVLGYFVYRYWKSKQPRPIYLHLEIPSIKLNTTSPMAWPSISEPSDAKENSDKPDIVFFKETGGGKHYIQNKDGYVLLEFMENGKMRTGWGPESYVGERYKLILTQQQKAHPNRFVPVSESSKDSSYENMTSYLQWGEDA